MRWIAAALGLLLCVLTYKATAHDQYGQLRNPTTGALCCNERVEHENGHVTGDCRPTGAEFHDGTWFVRINGVRMAVPQTALIDPLPDGRCHVCEMFGNIFCFAPCAPRI